MTKTLDNKNPDFAICDIAIQSQPLKSSLDLDRRCNSISEFRGSRIQKGKNTMQQESRFRDMRYRDSIAAIKIKLGSRP
jgi:hypothetical protein